MRSPVRSLPWSLLIFLGGALVGGVLVYALRDNGRISSRHEGQRQAAAESVATASRSRPASDENSDAQNLFLGEISTMPFQELYQALARQPPSEIARLARQLESSSPDPQVQAKIKTFFTAWARLDARSAFGSAVLFRYPENRTSAVAATVDGADAEALEGIARGISQLPADALPKPNRDNLLALAIDKWSELNPAGAAQLLDTSDIQGFQKSSALGNIALNWGREDPAAALRWAQEQPAVALGLDPVMGAVMGWWQKDPEGAEAYALNQLGTPTGKLLVKSLVGPMANKDRDAATAWVAKIPDEKLRNESYGMIAAQLAVTDPKTAAAWTLTLPQDAQIGAVASTAQIWSETNPSEAAQWINGLTGKNRDAAVESYADRIADTDPPAAMTWATTISDQTRRESTTRNAMRQWMARDPTAARSWVETSSLGADEKAKLLAIPVPSP